MSPSCSLFPSFHLGNCNEWSEQFVDEFVAELPTPFFMPSASRFATRLPNKTRPQSKNPTLQSSESRSHPPDGPTLQSSESRSHPPDAAALHDAGRHTPVADNAADSAHADPDDDARPDAAGPGDGGHDNAPGRHDDARASNEPAWARPKQDGRRRRWRRYRRGLAHGCSPLARSSRASPVLRPCS